MSWAILMYNYSFITNKPTSKPRGLNHAMQIARGDIVTIFDAEDEPHPDILNIINTTMLNDDVDAIQSGVQLMNHNTKWFCFLNVLEYFFWFKSSLHFFARVGMTPLGGNTVFVRRELMEQLGGWDETGLTEDADLGIRLSLSHARIRIIYDDEFVTREETPHTIEQFIKQRTRWNQGFIQILFKKEWMKLERLSQTLIGILCADLTRSAGILCAHDAGLPGDVLPRQVSALAGYADFLAALLLHPGAFH